MRRLAEKEGSDRREGDNAMDINKLYSLFLAGGLSTDSRSIKPGQVFFALKGETFDGDRYAAQALHDGAACAVVSEACGLTGERYISVPDTLAALKALARHHRRTVAARTGLKVIGLTGTNGKTTTKELITAVLSRKFDVHATAGNFNNDVGVPLTVLGITDRTQIAVVEMGASHPEDITALTCVCEPDYGLITNVGKAHILGFGSYEGVKKAKGRLYDFIKERGGRIFLNADDEVLRGMVSERGLSEPVRYGVGYQGAEVLQADSGHPFLRLSLPSGKSSRVLETNLVGDYNSANVLAAVCIGRFFGVPEDDIFSAIKAYVPSNKRSQLVDTGRNKVVLDAYNANLSSMQASLSNFSRSFPGMPKMAVLGDMKELGSESETCHEAVLALALEGGIDEIVLVGPEFANVCSDAVSKGLCRWFSTSEEALDAIKEEAPHGMVILVKGSHSMAMEKVLPAL